jgi:hypothetical protein
VGESGVLSALVGLFSAGAADSTVCNLLAAIKVCRYHLPLSYSRRRTSRIITSPRGSTCVNRCVALFLRLCQANLLGQGVMPIVVRQLSSPHPSVQDYAASALATLCGDNADALQQAIDEGCLPPLVRMLTSQNRGILISAYCTLAVLVPINRMLPFTGSSAASPLFVCNVCSLRTS